MASALPNAPLARSQSARAGFSPTATTTSPDSSSPRARLTTGNSAGATQRSETPDAAAAIPRIIARTSDPCRRAAVAASAVGGAVGSKGPVPSTRRRKRPAGMEPSRSGAAHACRVVVSTPPRLPRPKPRLRASFFELMNAAQFGKENHPEYGDGHRADAAEQHRRNRADECSDQARLERAQLVRGSGEQRMHGAHAAAHRIRRPDLDERGPDDHADHVRRAENGEGDEREREAGGEAEHDRGRPEEHDGTKEGGPDSPPQRIAGEEDRRRQGADGRGRAHESEPARTRVENVARVDGQERGGAAEQHREQVERHRAEQHPPAPDEGDSREDALERQGLDRAWSPAAPDD